MSVSGHLLQTKAPVKVPLFVAFQKLSLTVLSEIVANEKPHALLLQQARLKQAPGSKGLINARGDHQSSYGEACPFRLYLVPCGFAHLRETIDDNQYSLLSQQLEEEVRVNGPCLANQALQLPSRGFDQPLLGQFALDEDDQHGVSGEPFGRLGVHRPPAQLARQARLAGTALALNENTGALFPTKYGLQSLGGEVSH